MATIATNIILLTVLISVCQQTDGISLTLKQLGCYYKGGSFFTMKCTNHMKIHVVNSTLGRSADVCRADSKCCPSNYICTVDATPEHLQNLVQTCDGKETCLVTVYRQRCPVGSSTISDFESVTYTCRDTTQDATTTAVEVTTTAAETTAMQTIQSARVISNTGTVTSHNTVMTTIPALGGSRSPDMGSVTSTESDARQTNINCSKGNVEHTLLILSTCLNGLLIMALLVGILMHRNRLTSVKKNPAVSEQELYASNLSETRVETPSTYDTLTTSQPQQQSEPTYEPVDQEYSNVTSDPVKYENTQVNSTTGGSTGLNTRESTNQQQQTSTVGDYTEPYSHMPF